MKTLKCPKEIQKNVVKSYCENALVNMTERSKTHKRQIKSLKCQIMHNMLHDWIAKGSMKAGDRIER